MIATAIEEDTTVYPESDGKPMAETIVHCDEMISLRDVLIARYANDPNVFVGANNFVFYKMGDAGKCFAPDVYVVHGVPKKRYRSSFFVWKEEGHVPSVVFEITSPSTKKEDQGDKKIKCENLGVQEYFLYDPSSEYLKPPLQGWCLQHGRYAPIEPDKSGRLHSPMLGVYLKLDPDGLLRLYDARTGSELLRQEEREKRLERNAERAERNAERLKRNAELAKENADLAKRSAELAERNAEREAAARKQAEAENVRLREELARLQKG